MFRALAEIIQRRRNAYRAVFQPSGGQLGISQEIVLADLRKFCRATDSTAVVSRVQQRIDPIASAVLVGRREVWLRIMHHLHISDADLYRMVDPEGQPRSEQGTDY